MSGAKGPDQAEGVLGPADVRHQRLNLLQNRGDVRYEE
jgi:hypothetical protein